MRILAVAGNLSTISITHGGLCRRALHRKELTVPVYAKSLVHGWFSRDDDVEKLRKPLEKRILTFRGIRPRNIEFVKGAAQKKSNEWKKIKAPDVAEYMFGRYTSVNMGQEREPHLEKQEDSRNQSTNKKPYKKPGFRFERVFETMALRCGKLLATAACKQHKKTS